MAGIDHFPSDDFASEVSSPNGVISVPSQRHKLAHSLRFYANLPVGRNDRLSYKRRLQRLFVATAAHALARKRFEASVARPIAADIVALIPAEILSRARAADGNFYAWGATDGPRNASTYAVMEAGDVVLMVWNRIYHRKAYVTATANLPTFAATLWGSDEGGNTWPLVYFLSRPEDVHMPLSELEDYLPKLYLGLTPISKTTIERIHRDFGSLDNFLHVRLGAEVPHLIPTSNSQSAWSDAEGEGYEYGSNVPN